MYFSGFLRISLVFALALAVTGCATSTLSPDSSIPADPQKEPEALSGREPGPTHAQAPEPIPVPVFEDTPSEDEPQNPTKPARVRFTDIWGRIRAGFELNDRDNPYIERELRQFVAHPHYLRRVQRRAEPFLYLILQEVESRGMPTELTLLPAVESAFHPQAYSPNHAAGIWQFIPATGRHFGLQQNWWYDGRRDVLASTRAALDYLQRLHRRFGGDWELALAAYNAGQGSVGKAIRKNKRQGKGTDFRSLSLPLETRLYVPRLLALCRIIAEPDSFGITLEPIANQPRLAVVDARSQLDLALAAEMAEISTDELHRLNPGFNRWATAPEGPHRLLLPLDKAAVFHTRLTQLDPGQRIQWTRYRIKPGDSLSVIAQKHKLTVSHLKKVNNLRGSRIRAGRYLIIPTPSDRGKPDAAIPTPYLAKSRSRQTKGTPISYTVRPGDTLWDIGRAFKVSYLKLAKWNNLTPSATLRPRQKLLIWKQAGY
jgi:membrane-bound lytic murein transglycosylase D